MASRKRHAPYSDEEEGRITTDEEEGEIEESHKRHKSHKKSKKHKKDKKHKKKHRRSHRSETPEGDDRGSTPEMEAGEVIDNTDEENNSRDKAHSSRSSSMARSRRQRSVTPPSKKRGWNHEGNIRLSCFIIKIVLAIFVYGINFLICLEGLIETF